VSRARLQAELERIALERLASEREATRQSRRELARACLECIVSCLAGVVLLGLAFHTNDHATGMIFFYGGLVVGYSGITLALWGAYRRGQERGDW
jgi:hypothetical protein